MWNNRSAVVKFSASQKVKWNPPVAAAISHAVRRISHCEAIFHPPEGWISLKKAFLRKCFFLVGVAGFDSRACGRLVARGHNSPSDCCSVPLVLRIPPHMKRKCPPLKRQALSGVPGGIRTHGLSLRRRTLYPAELRRHIHLFIA